MLDINKAIKDPTRYMSDMEGNMADLAPWSPRYTAEQAELEGIEMTDEHWEVVHYMRERFREHGNVDAARDVLRDMENHFGGTIGRSHLYELFPGGPVRQASKLAGLPLPPHTMDPSFGSTM